MFKSWHVARHISRVLGQTLSSIILRMLKIEQTTEKWSQREQRPTRKEIQHLYIARMAVEHKLLTMPPAPDQFTPEQHAVRLALYLCFKPRLLVSYTASAFKHCTASQFRSCLERTDLVNLWSPHSDLLLWVLAVAARMDCKKRVQKPSL